LHGVDLGYDEVSGIIECRNIDKGHQLLQGGQSGEDMVGYAQRPWGIHIDMTGKG
jgi:hypothetical protein